MLGGSSGRRRAMLILGTALLALAAAATALTLGAGAGWAATLPPGNAAQQWDKIAEDTVVGGGALQPESFVYLAYVSAAMDGAVNPGERNGQNADAAVAQAAYDVLVHYFPAQEANLSALHDAALAAVPDGAAKRNGIMYGDHAAARVLRERAGDGLTTPIATTSPYTPLAAAAGVWRRTPPAYAPAQTPWMANVRPFILDSADHFTPAPPPSLQSQEWVEAFNEVKSLGAANSATRTAEQTATAQFYAANVPRQFNLLARTIGTNMNLDVPQTARLVAMVNEVGADALISMMHAQVQVPVLAPDHRDRPGVGRERRARAGAGVRRRQPAHGGAAGLDAVTADAESPGISVGALHDHFGSRRSDSAVLGHRRNRHRPRGGRELQCHPPLRDGPGSPHGGRKRARLGRSALPVLDGRRHPAGERGRRLRPRPRPRRRRLNTPRSGVPLQERDTDSSGRQEGEVSSAWNIAANSSRAWTRASS